MPSNNNASQSPTQIYNYEVPSAIRTNLSVNNHHVQTNGKINGKINGKVSRSNLTRFSPTEQFNFTPLTNGQNINLSMSSAAKQPLLDLSRNISIPFTPPLNTSNISPLKSSKVLNDQEINNIINLNNQGIHEILASLALMCLLSLLMAFLALFFLQRTGPIVALPEDSNNIDGNQKANRNVNHLNRIKIIGNSKEYLRVFQISVSLSTLTISLDLCCLFVCCIQFLAAVKLLKTHFGKTRTEEFLKKTSHIRIIAIGAFLISIPIFFTGVILFTFVNFDEIPALATSFVIGLGIIFCGIASIQSVYLWQWEKTKASRQLSESRLKQLRQNGYLAPLELSTLV